MPRRRLVKKPNSFYKKLSIVLIITALISAQAYAWYIRPIPTNVTYQPCAIKYGNIESEWDGQGDDPWNDKKFHYQVRSFSLTAISTKPWRINAYESIPKRISTGVTDACQAAFDETIDPSAEYYQWSGARVSDLRFGVAKASPDSDKSLLKGYTSDAVRHLSTPTYPIPERAAVWVDDGANAEIIASGAINQIWCVNYGGCSDISAIPTGGIPNRGSGFVYTSDNCPDNISCSDRWYQTLDYQKIIGQNFRSLKKFKLRLSSVSTYPDQVGAAMIMTFKYPRMTTARIKISGDSSDLALGESFKLSAELSRSGPALDGVLVEVKSSNLKDNVYSIKLNPAQLEEFNSTEKVNITLPLEVSSQATPGECYQLPVAVRDMQSSATIADSIIKYCLAKPDPVMPDGKVLTYQVKTRGTINSNLTEFIAQAGETLGDTRGWSSGGARLNRVDSGGDFILWLSAANQMTSFSSGCDAIYSCRVGDNVIINDTRWQQATPVWNQAGGSIRDYRHMVINHEVGHLLGLPHVGCPQAGALAPVMMQQSIDLAGCRFNPWPLTTELAKL